MKIIGETKQLLKRVLIANGVSPEYIKRLSSKDSFSHLGEDQIIENLLTSIRPEFKTDFIVDIAASDGISMSNTYSLFKSGSPGLAIEYDGVRFSQLASAYRHLEKVSLLKSKITPENVIGILDASKIPKNFSVLNLDIDSYDFFVLDALLGFFRPAVICAEINEKIPPPIKFTVKYDPSHSWGTDHFFGQSISKLFELCQKYDYSLVTLHYNNAFLVPREANRSISLTPEEAYDQGYRNKIDRKEKFPYNADMECVLQMAPQDARHFIEKAFERYQGKFDLYI